MLDCLIFVRLFFLKICKLVFYNWGLVLSFWVLFINIVLEIFVWLFFEKIIIKIVIVFNKVRFENV